MGNWIGSSVMQTAKWGVHWHKEPLVLPLFALAGASIQFYGPTVQCNDFNPSQQAVFDYFMDQYAAEANVFTVQQVESGNYTELGSSGGPGDATSIYGALVLSAFSPTMIATLTTTSSGQTGSQAILIQLSDQSFVCSAVNASFDIGLEFKNGVGSLSYQNIQILPATDVDSDLNGTNAIVLNYDVAFATNTTGPAYFTSFLALGCNIFGNLSLEDTDQSCIDVPGAGCSQTAWDMQVRTSRLALTGLVACDEFAHNAWYERTGTLSNETNFPSEPWMCRNRTLARSIEDLANNLTISMLSSANCTSNITVQITSTALRNVYRYDKTNLFISYGAVILVTLIVLVVGIVSLIQNGVYHDASFSTIMPTTRNPDIDVISQGACLGSTEDIAANQLMFGVLVQNESPEMKGGVSYHSGYGGAVGHVAFGFEGSVVRLRKGDACS